MARLRRVLAIVALVGVVGLLIAEMLLVGEAAPSASCGASVGSPSCRGPGTATSIVGNSAGLYAVTIVEAGLPEGLSWGVNVYAFMGDLPLVGSFNTTNGSQVLDLLKGPYFYTVVFPTGWAYGGHDPKFQVRGTRTVTVPYIPVTAPWEWSFTEHCNRKATNCLPAGTNWTISVNWWGPTSGSVPPDYNASKSTTGRSMEFGLYPGEIYCFHIGEVAGYYFGVADGKDGVITGGCLPIYTASTTFHLQILTSS